MLTNFERVLGEKSLVPGKMLEVLSSSELDLVRESKPKDLLV
jgi:hypothetical protein